MSILLQALKKSESQRELGNIPTLQTTTDPLLASEQEAPAWLPALLVLVAGVLVTWLGLQQYRLPEGFQEPGRGPAGAQSVARADSQSSSQQEPGAGQPGAEGQPGVAESTPASPENVRPQAGGRRSILPRLADTAETDEAEQEAQQPQQRLGRQVRDYAGQEAEAGTSGSAGDGPGTPTRDNAMRQAELAKVELASPEAAPRQNSGAAPESGTTANTEFEPEMISYWQVPEKMREGLPELRISVLVFAEQPEDRFLLLNGERLREGEQMSSGLLLEEIRRDRAIFNYRNYRFYLKS